MYNSKNRNIADVSKKRGKRTPDTLKDADFLVPNKNLMLKRVSNECSLCYGNVKRCILPLTSHSRHHSLTLRTSRAKRTLLATCSTIHSYSVHSYVC